MKTPNYDPLQFQREIIVALAGNPEFIRIHGKVDTKLCEKMAGIAGVVAKQYEIINHDEICY